MAPDGTYLWNQLEDKHNVRFYGYRADGKRMDQFPQEIAFNQYRYINNDHVGDADFFIVLAFMFDSESPEKIGVDSSSWSQSGSGSIGITVEGIGLGLGGGGGSGGTTFYSDSMAGVVVPLIRNNQRNRMEANRLYKLTEEPGKPNVNFGTTVGQQTNAATKIWKLEHVDGYNPNTFKTDGKDIRGW